MKGLSQSELAEIIGTDPVMIGRWERGINKPSYGMLRALCISLTIPPEMALELHWVADGDGGHKLVSTLIKD